MVSDSKKMDISLDSLKKLFSKEGSTKFERTELKKPKSMGYLLLFTFVLGLFLTLNFYIYNQIFAYNYADLLSSLFQFRTEFFNLFLLLPFSLLFSLLFIIVLAFSASFEESDGLYAEIISFVLIMSLSALILGTGVGVIISSLFLALAIPISMRYVRKRLGLFKIKQIFWKGSYILFIFVSAALACSFLTSFFVDYQENVFVTQQVFVDAPAVGATSGLEALKLQLRQAYEIGFLEGVDFQAKEVLSDFERQLVREEAKDRASEILDTETGMELLGMYAEQFPYFEVLLIVIPVMIAAAIFSVTFVFFTFILRPICVLLSLLLYERLMRLYVKINF